MPEGRGEWMLQGNKAVVGGVGGNSDSQGSDNSVDMGGVGGRRCSVESWPWSKEQRPSALQFILQTADPRCQWGIYAQTFSEVHDIVACFHAELYPYLSVSSANDYNHETDQIWCVPPGLVG